MPLTPEMLDKIEAIFLPVAFDARKKAMENKWRLAHYTTAENALNIISNRELWLRNARNMTDFSEVEYGYDQVSRYLDTDDNIKKFINALDECASGAGEIAIELFKERYRDVKSDSYITCFTLHEEDDFHGRLSMWRAFGRSSASVALVINPPNHHHVSPLNIFIYPVSYRPDAVATEFELGISRIKENINLLTGLQCHPQQIGFLGYIKLIALTVTLKHPGFHEEKEWRIIHYPSLFGSDFVTPFTKSISGIPQVIHKVRLENKPEKGLYSFSIPELLDRVIIGPSDYADTIQSSLIAELRAVGVKDPVVVKSEIPLRA